MFSSFESRPNQPDITKLTPMMAAFIGVHVPERQAEVPNLEDLPKKLA